MMNSFKRTFSTLLLCMLCIEIQTVCASPLVVQNGGMHEESALSPSALSLTPPISIFDQELSGIRYSTDAERAAQLSVSSASSSTSASVRSARSPLLALGLSLLLPGAGQIYNGDYLVGAGFAGVEAATWIFYAKFDREGKDNTEIYENFNRAHWSASRYSDYLQRVYGFSDDDSIGATEISHNLPDNPNDQQYFEQTGKYNQFAWGWDDASLVLSSGYTLTHGAFGDTMWNNSVFGSSRIPAAKDDNVPYSSNRTIYEGLRNDANNSFQNRDNTLFVAALNRVLSGLHAYFLAAKRNRGSKATTGGENFSQLDWSPRLESRYDFADTPVITLRWRF